MASVWTFFFVFVVEIISETFATDVEPRRTYELLSSEIENRNISSDIPPLLSNGSIPVEIMFQLNRIIKLDSATSTLSVSGVIEMLWSDARYAWVSNGTRQQFLFLPARRVWLPPIELVDSEKFNHRFGRINHLDQVLVLPDGLCSFRKRISFDVSCKINVEFFPWDVQRCGMTFQSTPPYWGIVKPTGHRGVNTTVINSLSEEWDVRATRHSVAIKMVADIRRASPTPINVYMVSFLLGRHGKFFMFTIIIPTIMLSMVTLVPYILPPAQCGQKLLIPVSTFLSFNIYMLLMERSMPKSATVPVIGQCYAILLAVGAITEIMQGISVKFYNCHLKRIPRPLVFLYLRVLGFMCCIGTCHGTIYIKHDDIQDDNKHNTVLKCWQLMGRINDRFGLFISACVILVVFLYLFTTCYAHSQRIERSFIKDW